MWWGRRARERDLERELCAHLELEAAEQRENGLVPETARDAAKRAMGNTTLVKEEVHDMYAGIALERFSQDLGYGCRSLRKTPSFMLAAILSLALGIEGNAAIFTAVNAVLLKDASGSRIRNNWYCSVPFPISPMSCCAIGMRFFPRCWPTRASDSPGARDPSRVSLFPDLTLRPWA
jgi:hypothetical protein